MTQDKETLEAIKGFQQTIVEVANMTSATKDAVDDLIHRVGTVESSHIRLERKVDEEISETRHALNEYSDTLSGHMQAMRDEKIEEVKYQRKLLVKLVLGGGGVMLALIAYLSKFVMERVFAG